MRQPDTQELALDGEPSRWDWGTSYSWLSPAEVGIFNTISEGQRPIAFNKLAARDDLSTSKSISPVSLRRMTDKTYIVEFNTPTGAKSFRFTISNSVVPIVSWEPEFRAFVGSDLTPARSLFESILAFHESQSSVLFQEHNSK